METLVSMIARHSSNFTSGLRYNNEVNLAIQSGEEVIAALQMLPYPMTFCNKIVPTSYISGACTHPITVRKE